MKKNKIKNYKSLSIILIILFFIISLLTLYKRGAFSSNLFFKVNSRVDKIKEESKKTKREIFGWIKIQGTNIDYPVLYNYNNKDLASANYNYTWINNPSEKLHNNIVIFGHNIRNVSSQPIITDKSHQRFEQLPSFLYYDFAKKNQYIQYTFNGKDYLYQIFSVAIVKEKYIDYAGEELNKKNFEEVVAGAKYDSYFDYDVKVTKEDKIISLVTCTRFYGGLGYDYKIVGKLVDKKIGIPSKVTEKKNYNNIKKKLTENKNQTKL
ncbi:MAG: class B sortase [Bacilli bacterium]|nr:class B sortase [Bacilli bacterium]